MIVAVSMDRSDSERVARPLWPQNSFCAFCWHMSSCPYLSHKSWYKSSRFSATETYPWLLRMSFFSSIAAFCFRWTLIYSKYEIILLIELIRKRQKVWIPHNNLKKQVRSKWTNRADDFIITVSDKADRALLLFVSGPLFPYLPNVQIDAIIILSFLPLSSSSFPTLFSHYSGPFS